MIEGALKAMAIFCFTLAGFKGAKAAEFTFNTYADGMGNSHHFLCNRHVVFVAGGSFGIGFKGAIHHH